MPCIASFSSAVSADCSTLTFTDTSTPAYNGETITARTLVLTDSTGAVTPIPWVKAAVVGDAITAPLTKDMVYSVTMTLTPSSIVGGSVYTSTAYVASACNAQKFQTNTIKTDILLRDTKNVLQIPDNILEKIEVQDMLLRATTSATSTGDLVTAQECLDLLTSLANEPNANPNY